jgi:universal stress protein E
MEHLKSILVVVDQLDLRRRAVTKATVLARHFGARVELFLCDSEWVFAIRQANDTAGTQRALDTFAEQGRRYLEALRAAMAPDVGVGTFVATSSPAYEAILQRVRETAPDLVIKDTHGSHAAANRALDASDWLLARTCPVPVMFTRGTPWAAQPRFAAAVDVADPAALELPRLIVSTASYLARGCHASLEVVYSEPRVRRGQARNAGALALKELGAEHDVQAQRLQLLEGAADQTLCEFVKRQHYDVLFLGALTRHGRVPGPVGTLTSQLAESLDCDLILLKPLEVAKAALSSTAPLTVRAPESGAAVPRVLLH